MRASLGVRAPKAFVTPLLAAMVGASLALVHGQLQSEQGVINVVSYRIEDHSHLLGALETTSRDFH